MGEDGFDKFFDSITPDGSYDAHDPTHRALRYTQEIAWRAGREAGMREAAGILKLRDERAFQNIKDFAEQEKVSLDENDYLLGRGDEAHGAYRAILAAIGEGK